ncbi:MAG: hypothetical protein PVJ21_13325 [Anaerolineales bacterium]
MSTNRFFTLLIISALMVGVVVSIRASVVISAASSEMDSATRSYIAWGDALKAANKEGFTVPGTRYDNAINSATRSYIAWGEALKAANKEGFMVPVTGYDNAVDSANQPTIAWAKACGVDLSYANNLELDSATRSLISRAMSLQCGNTP